MPVGLSEPEKLYPVAGVELATIASGIRYKDRDDMLLMTLAEGSTVAAVFTQNRFCAAPVLVAKEHLQVTLPRALLINSGNANAVTGELGLDNANSSCVLVAEALDVKPDEVLPFSTGVIGEQLPMDRIGVGITALVANLSIDNWLSAATAIMTTDTIAKGFSEQLELNGNTVTITGIAKGSGMICPNMATLLSYVATDANIEQTLMQTMLEQTTMASFNRITVDSDTSTNDSLVLVATGQSDVSINADDQSTYSVFYAALERVLISLATAIIRDGEGATKFVNVDVIGGVTQDDCRAVAYSVAHSPLVKTALFASDPNWGRILMAIGKAEAVHLEVDKVNVLINDHVLSENGQPAASYSEEIGQAIFVQEEITITIDLASGSNSYNVWTSDLSHDYVSINADYRS
jgi:glutamate N-acetyltransferase/amino-acid N-acetyltransferase